MKTSLQLCSDEMIPPCVSVGLMFPLQVRDGGGEDALQLDVHLPLSVPQGNRLFFTLLFNILL